jgi:hypothetical protein
MITFVVSFSQLRSMQDFLPGFGSSDRVQVHMAWTFATILLGVVSLPTAVIASICFIILLIKHDASRELLLKAFAAIALAWASLGAAVMMLS